MSAFAYRPARLLLLLALPLSLSGCAGCADGDAVYRTCSPPCPQGTRCDNATGTCVTDTTPDATPPPPSCTGRTIRCGSACVDPYADPQNCGDCGQACGEHASCENGHCSCAAGHHDCNGSFADGCECAQGCDGAACATTPPPGCDPAQAFVCGADDTSKWCDAGIVPATCRACATGKHNCDGKADCESSTACDAPECSASTKFHCGDDSRWCDGGACKDCPAGKHNCDGVDDCEASTCDPPECAADSAFSCGAGDTSKWCDGDAIPATCKPCAADRHNCDGKNDCETTTACCSPAVAFDCGGDQTYCATDHCAICATGKYNCDGKNSCEAAGKCCSPAVAFDCGAETEHCDTDHCAACPSGQVNCDGTDDCEKSGSGCCSAHDAECTTYMASCTGGTCFATGCCCPTARQCRAGSFPVCCPEGQVCKSTATGECG